MMSPLGKTAKAITSGFTRSTPLSLSRTSEISILAVVLGTATILRFYSLDALPLWFDEGFTYEASRLPLSKLFFIDIDTHPPVFYLIEKFALEFGNSELILRFAPAVFGIAAVYMLYLIGRRFVSPVCGLSAAAFIATSSVHIQYSQEARSYTLLFLEICIAAYGVLKFIEDSKNRGSDRGANSARGLGGIAIYLIGALTALYTHNIAVFYVFVLNLTVLLAWRPLSYITRDMLVYWIAAQAVLLILWMPWFIVLIDQAQGDVFSWLKHLSLRDAVIKASSIYGFRHTGRFQPAADIFVIFLLAAGLAAASYRRYKAAAILAGLFIVMVPAVMWAVGFIKPVFMIRTLLGTLIGSTLGLGLAVAFASRRWVALLIVALIVTGNIKSTMSYYQYAEKEEWKRAVTLINSGAAKDDLIIICEFGALAPFSYYQDKSSVDLTMSGWVLKQDFLFEINDGFMQEYLGDSIRYRSALNKEDFVQHYNVKEISDIGGSYNKIWLVESHCFDGSKKVRARVLEAGYTIRSIEHLKGIEVIMFAAP